MSTGKGLRRALRNGAEQDFTARNKLGLPLQYTLPPARSTTALLLLSNRGPGAVLEPPRRTRTQAALCLAPAPATCTDTSLFA